MPSIPWHRCPTVHLQLQVNAPGLRGYLQTAGGLLNPEVHTSSPHPICNHTGTRPKASQIRLNIRPPTFLPGLAHVTHNTQGPVFPTRTPSHPFPSSLLRRKIFPQRPRAGILTYDFGELLPAERDPGQLHADSAEAPAQSLRRLFPPKRELPAGAGPEVRGVAWRGRFDLGGSRNTEREGPELKRGQGHAPGA